MIRFFDLYTILVLVTLGVCALIDFGSLICLVMFVIVRFVLPLIVCLFLESHDKN